MTERDPTPGQQQERERISEHFHRGLALGKAITIAADEPQMLTTRPGPTAGAQRIGHRQPSGGPSRPRPSGAANGHRERCAEWIAEDEPARCGPADDVDLTVWARALAHRLAGGAGAIVVEASDI